jgi:hypothetical protein
MQTEVKKSRKRKATKVFAVVNPDVGNYEKHPFFVKKANEAKALINAVGLPDKPANAK